MRVNISVQTICVKPNFIRGIQNYTIDLLKALKKREKNDYSISFFDYNKERRNIEYVKTNLGNVFDSEHIYECNSLDFRQIMQGIANADLSVYGGRTFGECIGLSADVYHIPESAWIPQNFETSVVVTVHDVLPFLNRFSRYWDDKYRNEFRASMEFAKKKRYEIMADSENTKRDIISVFEMDDDKIHVVPIAFSKEKYFPDKRQSVLGGFHIERPFLLYLGAIDARKGIQEVVDAFENISKSYDVQLVIAGNPEPSHKDELSFTMEKAHRNPNVIFTGYVSDEQKRVLMSNAEMFLFPSEYEGFGLPVLESMACGTPVITTNVSSLPEVGGDAVVYVTPKQSEELVAAIESILDNTEYRNKLIQRGFEQCEKFSWDKTAELTEKVYKIAKEQNG